MNNNNIKNWKQGAKKYLAEIEKFLDLAENIKEDELKQKIIIQMLKVDNELTKEAEKIFENLKTI